MKRTLLLLLVHICICAYAFHPVHISVINLNYNRNSGDINYSLRCNQNDFLYIINTLYGVELSFKDESKLLPNQKVAIEKYINSRFEIQHAENKLTSKLTTWKTEDESVWLNFEVEANSNISKFEITNTLMLDAFHDQQNLLIFATDTFEKGFTFTKETSKQVIVF